jgi:TPR repeat protein
MGNYIQGNNTTTTNQQIKNPQQNEINQISPLDNKIYEIVLEEDNESQELNVKICFKNLYGVKRKINEAKAKKICIELSKKGDPLAEGLMNFFGWDLTLQNSQKAIEFCQKSLISDGENEESSSYSYLLLGLIYNSGKGIDKNLELSIKNFKISVKQSNCIAMYFLSLLYLEQIQVKNRFEKILKILEKSADLGNILSMKKLAELYSERSKINVFF